MPTKLDEDNTAMKITKYFLWKKAGHQRFEKAGQGQLEKAGSQQFENKSFADQCRYT